MPGKSSKTVPVNFRITVELAETIQKRIAKRSGKWANVNDYARRRFIYDVNRPH